MQRRETWGYLIQAVPRSNASSRNNDPNCDDQVHIPLGSRVSQQIDHGNLAPALTRRVEPPAGETTSGAPRAEVWLTELSSMNVTYTLGRRNCRVHVRHSIRQYISRDHCRISSVREESNSVGVYIRDISANGTYVNGQRIDRERPVKLQDGDVISLVSPHVVETNTSNRDNSSHGGTLEAFLFVFREARGSPAGPSADEQVAATSSTTQPAVAIVNDNRVETEPLVGAEPQVASFFTGTGAGERAAGEDDQSGRGPQRIRSNTSVLSQAFDVNGNIDPNVGSRHWSMSFSDFLNAVGSSGGRDDSLMDSGAAGGRWYEEDMGLVSPPQSTLNGTGTSQSQSQSQSQEDVAQEQVNRALAFGLRRILPGLRRRRAQILAKPPHISTRKQWKAKKIRRVVDDSEEMPLR